MCSHRSGEVKFKTVQLARQPEPDGATRRCNQQTVQLDGATNR